MTTLFAILLVLALPHKTATIDYEVLPDGTVIGNDSATYTIPAGLDLKAPMTLDLREASLTQANGIVSMRFRLPQELDGAEARAIELKGFQKGNRLFLEGPKVSSSCLILEDSTSCHLMYDEIKLQNEAADLFIEKTILDGALKLDLKNAREALEHQAVGVISFEKKPSPDPMKP